MSVVEGFISNDLIFIFFPASRLLGYEGMEVINPEGGKEDAEEEAQRGRWKQEVGYPLIIQHLFYIEIGSESWCSS